MDDLFELKTDYENKKRIKENLEKNFDRRKRLNILEPDYERQIIFDIKKLDSEIAFIERKIRSIQSERLRKKFINQK